MPCPVWRLTLAAANPTSMSDQRSVLKEYRALEQKRLAQGLTPAEGQRHAQLKALVGPEGGGAPRGGFDVNAAAAKLRESLLPAGLRNRPPPPPEPVTPEQLAPEEEAFFSSAPGTFAPPAPEAQAVEAAWAEQPFATLETPAAPADALFDPSSLGGEEQAPAAAQEPTAGWDLTTQQPYADPNAAWDPNAQQPYDPNAAWDPNAQQAYDPNAAAQAGWEPNAQAYADPYAAAPADAAWDPASLAGVEAAPAEGAAVEAPALDAAPAEYDGDHVPAAAVPGEEAQLPEATLVEGDPAFSMATDADGAQGDWAASAPAAAPHDGVGYPGEPGPAQADDPYALVPEADAAGAAFPDAWDPSGAPVEPLQGEVALGEYDGAGPASFVAPAPEDGALPFDAAAASAIDPAQLPEGFEAVPGEYDDNAGFGVTGYEAPPVAHLADEAAHAEAPSWQPDAALDQGFALASGGSFDAAADARSPDWAGAAPEADQPWAQRAELTDPEPEPDLGAPVELDRSAPDLTGDVADDFFAISAPPLALGGPGATPASAPQPEAEPELGALDSLDLGREPEPAPPPPTPPPSAPRAPVGPPPGLRAAAIPAPAPAPIAPTASLPPEPMPSIDEIPELEADEFVEPVESVDLGPVEVEETPVQEEVVEEIVQAPEAAGEAAPDLDFPSTIAEPFPPSPSPAAVAAAAASARPAAPAAPARPPPPILRPQPAAAIAPPAPPAAPAPEAEPEEVALPLDELEVEEPQQTAAYVPGVHRVVVHTLEGLVKRGVLTDADLASPVLGLAPSPSAEPEVLGADRVKAIFFMLAPGEAPPAAEGKRVRVTFKDGRQVAGFSPDYQEGGIGFFMVPADNRTNTGRIWIYRAAVKQVAVG